MLVQLLRFLDSPLPVRQNNFIDPPPHFLANTDDITLVGASRKLKLVDVVRQTSIPATRDANDQAHRERALVATESKEPPFWRSVLVPLEERDKGLVLERKDADALEAKVGDELMFLPIKVPASRR